MEIMPPKLQVTGRCLDGEPKTGLTSGGEDTRGGESSHASSLPLPPLALEASAFRGAVWAHMDPCKRKRLNLEDFEDRLNVLPLETTNNVRNPTRSLWEWFSKYLRFMYTHQIRREYNIV